jgi:hypothetical protein
MKCPATLRASDIGPRAAFVPNFSVNKRAVPILLQDGIRRTLIIARLSMRNIFLVAGRQ